MPRLRLRLRLPLPLRLALTLVLLVLAAPLRALDVAEVTSPGGITAWLVEEHSIPMIALEAEFEGGAMLDPDDRLGATRLMAGLLNEGSGDLDALAFEEAADDLALRFGASGRYDSVGIWARMLSARRDESVDLLATALSEPRFDEAAVERVRGQMISGLRADVTDPGEIGSAALRDLLYPGHPYARSSEGTLETVPAITVEDLRAAHERALTRSRLTVGVVGDITPEELGPMLDRIFGALPADGPPLPGPADIPPQGTLQVIDYDSPQSIATFAHEGLTRDDPDFLAAYVANWVLGGAATSRLNREIRVNRGLTYGVYSGLSPDPRAPLVTAGLSSANSTMPEAVELIRAAWAEIAARGITADELAEAKRFLTGNYPLQFATNGQIAGNLVSLQISGLPLTYVDERNAVVEALTLDEVNAAAARLYDAQALKIVVVGRPEGMPATQ